MQAIIDSLPERVLNYKDPKGNTIIDAKFLPFYYPRCQNIKEMNEDSFLVIDRPRYAEEIIECNGRKLKLIKERVEGNIQEAIDHKIKRVVIEDDYRHPCNSFEDDVYKLLDGGHIQAIMIEGNLKSNGKQYHVDFMDNRDIGDNITSYYNCGRETAKTVVLVWPEGPITNNLITLGYQHRDAVPYSDTITSKFICHTSYPNARDHLKNQDILDMLDALKAKIEAL